MSQITVVKRDDGKIGGRLFGKLIALHKTKQAGGRDWWMCRCECGVTKEVIGKSLRSGSTRSCGCRAVRAAAMRFTTHGLAKHPLFGVYKNIRNRCYNTRADRYRDYGGRGIECLFKGAEDFISWALAVGWQQGLTVDRKDNDGPYSRANCRVVDYATQSRNSRRNVVVLVNGELMCFKDAARAVGIKYSTATKRIHKYGATIKQALGLTPWPRSRL